MSAAVSEYTPYTVYCIVYSVGDGTYEHTSEGDRESGGGVISI